MGLRKSATRARDLSACIREAKLSEHLFLKSAIENATFLSSSILVMQI